MADVTVSFSIQNLTSFKVAPISNSPAYYVLNNGAVVEGKTPREVSPNSSAEGGTYSHKPPKLAVAVAYTIPDSSHYAVFYYQDDSSDDPVIKALFVPTYQFSLDSGLLQNISNTSAFGKKAQHGFYLGPNYLVLKLVGSSLSAGNVRFTISVGMEA